MRAGNQEHMAKLAKTVDGPFCRLAAAAVDPDLGRVVPSVLRAQVEAGHKVEFKKGAALTLATVTKDGVVIAHGMSDTENDALMHAVHAEMKEEAKAAKAAKAAKDASEAEAAK